MSGPKGGSYRVESVAERQARLLRSAEAAEQSVLARIAAFEREASAAASAYGTNPVRVSVGRRARREAAAVQQWAADAEAALAAARATLGAEVAAARADLLLGSLGGLAHFTTLAPTSSSVPVIATAEVEESWRQEITETVEGAIRSMDADCSDEVRAAVQSLASEALQAPTLVRARQLATLLGNDVGRANRSVRAARARRSRIEQLSIALAAWDHPETRELAAALAAGALDSVDIVDVEAQVRRAVEQAAADRDREVVAAAIRRSLQSQGYVVQEGFETLVVSEGVAHVRAKGWTDHAVRVRLFDDRPRVAFNVVVREGDGGEVRDAEVEREWCGDIAGLISTLEDEGVDIDLTHRVDPGVAPVQAVDADAFPFEERAERRAPIRKAKEQST